jgi:hypothetical protein
VEAQRSNFVLGFASNAKPNAWRLSDPTSFLGLHQMQKRLRGLLSALTSLFGILPMQNRMRGCSAHQPRAFNSVAEQKRNWLLFHNNPSALG